MNDADFWEEAELISTHVENTFQGNYVLENDKLVVCENLNDIHSSVAVVNQATSGIPIVPEKQVPVVIQREELLVGTVPCDQPINCLLSNSSVEESFQVNVGEVMNDVVSSGVSVVNKHGDQATNFAIAESNIKESCQLKVNEAMNNLVRDMVSNGGSVVTNHGDKAANCALSKSNIKESCQLNVDEAMCDLVRDMVVSGSDVINNGDQATNCAFSKSNIKESVQLNVAQTMSDLIRDTVSTGGSVVINHEQPVAGTGEAELSFPNLQDLMEQYNSEKLHFENVSGKHVQVLSAFMGSYSRLRLLHEKKFKLRKELREAEKELAYCEAETLEFGASCRELAGEMAESQKRMQETAEKLGKEVEAMKQKEVVSIKRKRS